MNAKLIDHTLLKAIATKDDIYKLCEEAKEYGFKSVCVNPTWVVDAKSFLHNSDVLICTVIGFPLGANTIETKVFETFNAIENGADEIDLVINIGKVKDHDYDYIKEEIRKVVHAANQNTVKVIIETCYLTKEEIVKVCEVATQVKANFVKTSTGFGTSGATEEDVKLMKESIAKDMEVKASGGIKTKADAIRMINAGATRIGTSNGVELAKEGE